MYKVAEIETKTDKHGNPMKVVSFEGLSKKVFVNSKYEREMFDKVELGASYNVDTSGEFFKIVDAPAVHDPISQNMDKKNQSIKEAGAQRDAVLLTTTFYPELAEDPDKEVKIKQKIDYWRDVLLGEVPF